MKKFYIILISIIVIFSLSMVTLYLLRDDEVLTYSASRLYYNYKSGMNGIDPEVEIKYNVKNKKKGSSVSFISSDDSIVEVKNKQSGKRAGAGPLEIKKAGEVDITVILTNSRGVETHSFIKTVYIGDGTSTKTPFYIYDEITLKKVGTDSATFSLTANYKQVNDIRLTGDFKTIEGVFEGSYNGLGYTIFNYQRKPGAENKDTSAMFEENAGKIGYIIFKEVDIFGSFNNASVVAKTNRGQIDFVSVYGKIENLKQNGYTAAIANYNLYPQPYNAHGEIPQVIRCANYAEITAAGGTNEDNYSVVGGIVSENEGYLDCNLTGGNERLKDDAGNIRQSGGIYLNGSNYKAGGITGINRVMPTTVLDRLNARPRVSDNYVNSAINYIGSGDYRAVGYVGGVIGFNINVNDNIDGQQNYIFGNYYVAYNISAETPFGEISETKVYNRGIGNGYSSASGFTTIESQEATYSARKFITLGITVTEAMGDANNAGRLCNVSNIISSAKPSSDNNYMDEKYWNTAVWDIGMTINGDAQFPILKTDSIKYDFTGIYVDMPVVNTPVSQISSVLIRDFNEYFAKNYTNENTSGTNGTYYIVNDLDFTGYIGKYDMSKFIDMTSNITGYKLTSDEIEDSKTNPNFELPASKGKIKISNLTIDAGSLLDISGIKNLGVFSSVLSSNISNIIFENIIVTGFNGVEDIGLIVGEMRGGSLNNIEVRTSANAGEYASKIVDKAAIPVNYLNVGGVVGEVQTAASLFNITAKDISISVNLTANGRLGGVFGYLGGTNNVNNITAEIIKIEQKNITGAAFVGGLAGYIKNSSVLNTKITAVNSEESAISGNSVGGICETAEGSGFSKVEVDLWTSGISSGSNSAGAVVNLYKNINGDTMNNIHTKVRFKHGNAAGFVYNVNSGVIVNNAVIENDFKNSGSKYAKTQNMPEMNFTGWTKPKDRNYNNIENKGVAASFNNIFYYNLQGKADNITVYTIYNDKGANDEDAGGFLLGWLFPNTKRDRTDWAGAFNSSYGTGRIDENGRLTTINQNESQTKKGQAAQNANFSSNIWNNVNAGMPTLKF